MTGDVSLGGHPPQPLVANRDKFRSVHIVGSSVQMKKQELRKANAVVEHVGTVHDNL